MDFPFIEYLLDSVSEKSTICDLVSEGNTDQLLQIDVKYVFDFYCILIRTQISLSKVDKNHNSLLTNKHRLKFKKKLQSNKLYIPYIGDKSFTQVTQANVANPNFIFALKISSDEEFFIAMGTFCHNWLTRNAIASTPKCIDRGFSEPNNQILQML